MEEKLEKMSWIGGFAIVMALVLVLVIIYTIIKLRKQVGEAEKAEKEKKARKN